MEQSRHLWIRGSSRAARIRMLAGMDVPPVLAMLDAHRRLRGPYTAAGGLLRQLVPLALQRVPRLVARHHVEIVAAAPELAELIPASVAAGGTRPFRPAGHTLRLADGIAEFVAELHRASGNATVMIDNLQHADPTDLELVAVLLRRVDPGLVTVVAGSAWLAPDRVTRLLGRYCVTVDIPRATAEAAGGNGAMVLTRAAAALDAVDEELGASFVACDGTTDDPLVRLAYQQLPAPRRAQLHDRRADELERTGELSWRLGAVPWHRERGRDPAGAGVAALRFAADHCLRAGFHDAAAELSTRGRAVVDVRVRPREWWAFTSTLTTALAVLGRLPEAEVRSQRSRAAAAGSSAGRHLVLLDAVRCAADLAADDRDGLLAWIVGATQLAEPAATAVLELACQAAAELREPAPPVSARRVVALVDQAIAHLGAGRNTGLRAELLGVRARAHGRLRDWEDALADHTAAAGIDPAHAGHHHERAVVLHLLGRHAEAAAGFDRAIALAPPFPRAHLARADTRCAMGDHGGAVADLRYVLELRPSDLDAQASLATLLQSMGAPRDRAHPSPAVPARSRPAVPRPAVPLPRG